MGSRTPQFLGNSIDLLFWFLNWINFVGDLGNFPPLRNFLTHQSKILTAPLVIRIAQNSCDQKCSLTLANKWLDFIQTFKMPDLKFKIVHRLESTTLYIWWYAGVPEGIKNWWCYYSLASTWLARKLVVLLRVHLYLNGKNWWCYSTTSTTSSGTPNMHWCWPKCTTFLY